MPLLFFPQKNRVTFTNVISSGNGEAETRVLSVNNATFTYPSSPLLTQGVDVPENILCPPDFFDSEGQALASRCRESGTMGKTDSTGTCECVHVRRIPLGSTVEIILFDQGRGETLFNKILFLFVMCKNIIIVFVKFFL